MPQYAYAVIIVDGKRKVIKTKGYPGAKVILAKNELEKDLKAAGIEYTYIGISENPPTTADLKKVNLTKNPSGHYKGLPVGSGHEGWIKRRTWCIINPLGTIWEWGFLSRADAVQFFSDISDFRVEGDKADYRIEERDVEVEPVGAHNARRLRKVMEVR